MSSPGRQPDGSPPTSRDRRDGPAAGRGTVIAALLVAVAAVATALAGPLVVRWHATPGWLGVGWTPPPAPPPLTTSTLPLDAEETAPPQVPVWLGEVVRWLAVTLAVALVAAVVVLVVRVLRDRWRTIDKAERAQAPAAGAASSSDELDEPARAEIERGVADASRALRAALPPGDAVVAAWLALERAAAGCGVERPPAATASEFTVTLLDRTLADPRAARVLLGLYQRARFSDHEVHPRDVDDASAALDTLAAALVTT